MENKTEQLINGVSVNKLKKWREMSDQLKSIKEEEMQLRKEIINELGVALRTPFKIKNDDINIKAKRSVEMKVDDKDSLRDDYEGMPPEIQACFPISYGFSKTAYNSLDAEGKSTVHEYVIEKEGAPTLEVNFK